ncbi:MAG: IS630 family transposase [Bacteroidota bacterium]
MSLDLYFADESGFNMQGYIPYGWQPKGEYIQITPSKTRGTQIFGLMSLSNDLESYSMQGSMNSAVVMAFLDDFKSRIKQPTVVVLDNAPIHHSKEFEAKIEQWKKEDLYIFFLPRYSPHLNPIEILWRMIKYHWLPYEDLESQEELNQKLEKILCDFGTKYTINFKE